MTMPLIGVSKSIVKIKELITHISDTCLNVLITGETGVGKEVVARRLYFESVRSSKNFVKINCAALPDTLLESELYGYEKGAFTGAEKKRQGKFQMANNGVLFLDEIGDMPLALQSKILHVLQSGEFSPLGSNHEFKSDVWIMAATNQNLKNNIIKKTFREDLYYRLNIIEIEIPPLRERKEDIPLLIEHYLNLSNSDYPENKIRKPDSDTLTKFCNYSWPGNVRQLKNCVKKQMVLKSWRRVLKELPKKNTGAVSNIQTTGTHPLTNQDLANDHSFIISEYVDVATSSDKSIEDISLKKIKKLATNKIEKEVIKLVLDKVVWNRTLAAKILKISYKTLLNKMNEFEVQRQMG